MRFCNHINLLLRYCVMNSLLTVIHSHLLLSNLFWFLVFFDAVVLFNIVLCCMFVTIFTFHYIANIFKITNLTKFPKHFQNISKTFPKHFQNISKIFPKYFQNISKIFLFLTYFQNTNCFQSMFQENHFFGLKYSSILLVLLPPEVDRLREFM